MNIGFYTFMFPGVPSNSICYYINGTHDKSIQIDMIFKYMFDPGLPGKCLQKVPIKHCLNSSSGPSSGQGVFWVVPLEAFKPCFIEKSDENKGVSSGHSSGPHTPCTCRPAPPRLPVVWLCGYFTRDSQADLSLLPLKICLVVLISYIYYSF